MRAAVKAAQPFFRRNAGRIIFLGNVAVQAGIQVYARKQLSPSQNKPPQIPSASFFNAEGRSPASASPFHTESKASESAPQREPAAPLPSASSPRPGQKPT